MSNPYRVWRETRQTKLLHYWIPAEPVQVAARINSISTMTRRAQDVGVRLGKSAGQFDVRKKHAGAWKCQIGAWHGGTVIECSWKSGPDALGGLALAFGSLALDFVMSMGVWGNVITLVLFILAVVNIITMYGDWRLRTNGPREVMNLLNATLLTDSAPTSATPVEARHAA